MSYPGSYDSYTALVNYQDVYSQSLALADSAVPFIITVDHDILSDVSFSAIYGTEVNTTPAAGQFRVLYGTNKIELGPLSSPSNIIVTFKCAGDIIYAEHVNNLQTAVVNIEDTLGLNPQGTYNNVAERLDNLTSAVGLIPASQLFTTDGVTKVFVLAYAPKYPEAVWVYVNGLRAIPGTHYLIVGSQIIFITQDAPKTTDVLYVDYFR